MKKIILTVLILLQSIVFFAQEYSFISKDLHEMEESEMIENNVQFNPAIIKMYTIDGNIIAANQINDIMMSGNFMPVIFGNKQHEPIALVFRKSTKEEKEQLQQAMSMQDPNANFTTGIMAKNFATVDLEGEKVSLADLKGKVVVLNFWFTTCPPCIAEMPELNKMVKKYKNKNVEFIAITFESKEKIKAFLKEHKFNYKTVSDNSIVRDYNVSIFPLNMIIDQNGEIIFKKVGDFIEELDIKIGLLLNK